MVLNLTSPSSLASQILAPVPLDQRGSANPEPPLQRPAERGCPLRRMPSAQPTLTALLFVAVAGCGGRVAFEPAERSAAGWTVRYADGSSRSFEGASDSMRCVLSTSDYLSVTVSPEGDASATLRFELGPAGSGEFSAAGEAIAQEGGTFRCFEPCVSFTWSEGDVGASSQRYSEHCEMLLVEEPAGWRGAFECRDMISLSVTAIAGDFYCAEAELVTGVRGPT